MASARTPRRERLYLFALARDGMTKEARELLESKEDVDVDASVASLTPIRTASEVRLALSKKKRTFFSLLITISIKKNERTTERSCGNGTIAVGFRCEC